MSWTDRLAPTIKLTSPRGLEFEALWRGNDRKKEKKLGEFSPPKRAGTIVQDLDITSVSYPLTFIFDGDNHDLTAKLFFEACSENGVWNVTHPMHGKLELQLISVVEKDQPITNGNFTEFESQWIEPLKDDGVVSSAELAEGIQEQIKQLNDSTAGQLEDVSDQSTASRIQALKNAAGQVSNAINVGLSSLSELSADIARVTNAIQRSTTANLANPLVQVNSLATQIQVAAQAPSLATDNIQSRSDDYATVIEGLTTLSFDNPTPENINFAAMKEIGLVSLTATLSQIVSTGELTTRSEAVTLAETLSDTLDLITNSLDQDQEIYQNNLLENQYFSQSQSYSDLVLLIGLGIEYLLRASFDLSIEKRFVLNRDRSPIEITISEYGTLGDNDENFDLFISSNNLKDKEILLLPAGKEVVVYV